MTLGIQLGGVGEQQEHTLVLQGSKEQVELFARDLTQFANRWLMEQKALSQQDVMRKSGPCEGCGSA